MSRRRRVFRWLLWLPLVLLVLVLALAAGLLGLLASEGGSTWLLRQAADAAGAQGVEVRFDRSRGSLLDRLEIAGLEVQVADTRVEARRLVLQWRPRALFDRLLHVERLEADGLRVTPPPAPDSEPPAQPLALPELQLPLTVRVDLLQLTDAAIVQPGGPVALDRLALSAVLDREGLAIRDLALAAPGAQLSGEASLQGVAPHALKGRLSAQVDESLTGAEIGPVEADATLAGTALQPDFDLSLRAPAALRLRGSLQLDRPQPGFDLSADWAALDWPPRPPTGAPGEARAAVSTRDGRIELRGTAEDYHLTLRTRVALPDMPAGELALEARGDLGGLTLEPLTVALPEGRLQADGTLRWEQGLRWQLALLAERLNLGLFQPDWPGAIDAHVLVDGSLGPEGADSLAASAQIEQLGGSLRGYPVSARGRVDWRAGQLLAEGLQLASGPNRVALDGRAGERLDLAFTIEAPDLASLYPGLGGRLDGKGQLSGTPAAPGVVASLSGGALAFGELRVQEVGLDVDWKDQGGRGRLSAAGLAAGATVLDTVTAEVDGSPEAHRLDLAATGPDGSLALGAQGGLRGESWQGRLQRLSLNAPGLGEWGLKSPAELELGAARARSGPLCLAQPPAELCTEGGWDASKGLDLAGRLRGLDLAQFASYLPGAAVVVGSLAADFSVSGQTARPTATLEVRPSDGRIRFEDAEQPFDLAFRNVQIKGRFADDRASADLRLELGSNGRASGQLSLGAEQAGQRALGGEIQAEFPDLSLVAGFVPALDEVQGRLRAAIRLGGSLAAPQLTGGLQVSDARARVPAAGILLTNIELAVQGEDARPLQVTGQLQSGGGRIDLEGTVDPAAAGGAAVDLRVRGDRFEAARLPEARVQVSPDLRLAGNGPYRLTGVLRIPLAAIELKEVPSGTVAVSEDAVVVGEETPAPSAPAARNLTAKVRVELGDEVTFKGFGLSTKLAGALDATVDDRGTLVDGKIELSDASYKAYGQDLTVERGRLVFAGPPGNPELDLRALRVSRDGNVKAYLSVIGPVSKPRSRVFSEPSLPDAEALAYLLTGRGLDQAGQQEGSAIAGAALSLGLSKSEPLLQDMSDRLGLDELRVESGANGLADSSLILGKYLNPDLYLGYAQGLFNPEGAVLLRLQLSDRLEVESRSGAEQSVDLFYKFEHD